MTQLTSATINTGVNANLDLAILLNLTFDLICENYDSEYRSGETARYTHLEKPSHSSAAIPWMTGNGLNRMEDLSSCTFPASPLFHSPPLPSLSVVGADRSTLLLS